MMNTNRILVLENDSQYFDFIAGQLSVFGYTKAQFFHVRTVEEINATDAKAFSPNIIFTCIDDQDNNRILEKYRHIQQLFPLAAVIIFSEKDENELAIKCVQAGAQSFMGKGKFSPSQLYRLTEFSRERYKHSQSIEMVEARNNQSALINASNHLIWSVDAQMKLLSFQRCLCKKDIGNNRSAYKRRDAIAGQVPYCRKRKNLERVL